MQLTSPNFTHQQPIPQQYTCQGDATRPVLEIAAVPAEAKSLALIVTDPDSPVGDYIHWLVWNIDPATTTIDAAALPNGAIEGVTSTGRPGYIAPCPHQGEHRYNFELVALKSQLSLAPTSDVAAVRAAMDGHILTTATLQGLYQKQTHA